MNGEDLDRKLSRMLAAVGADAQPALLTRARARIEARAAQPWLVRWAMGPAALGASVALFVVSAGLSLALVSTVPGSEASDSVTWMETMLAEHGIEPATLMGAPEPEVGAAADSGGAR
jgi:hypothetical protein